MSDFRLIWEVWVPVLRNCVAKWQPRNVGPMVDLVDCWAPVLPLWILDYVLEQLIFPRLQKEVTNILYSEVEFIFKILVLRKWNFLT